METGWVKEPGGTMYCLDCFDNKAAEAQTHRGLSEKARRESEAVLTGLIAESKADAAEAQMPKREYKPRAPKVRWGMDVAGGAIVEAKETGKR